MAAKCGSSNPSSKFSCPDYDSIWRTCRSGGDAILVDGWVRPIQPLFVRELLAIPEGLHRCLAVAVLARVRALAIVTRDPRVDIHLQLFDRAAAQLACFD